MSKRVMTADAFETVAESVAVATERQGVIAPSLARASAKLDVEIIRGRTGFEALETEWNALFERAGRSTQLFQQFNWLWHCARVYGAGPKAPEVIIATARVDGRLVLVWPLQLTCTGLCRLTWFGDPVGQYGDVLMDRLPAHLHAEALEETWQQICETVHPDLVVLRRVREDSLAAPFLKSVRAHVTEQNEAPALGLSMARSFGEYCKTSHTRHARKERRRLKRRLDEMGAVSYSQIHDPMDAAEVARQSVHMKRAWMAEKHKASKTLADDRVLEFLERVAEARDHPVNCEVHAVHCDGELASAQIAFSCKGRLAVHVIVYNTAYQRAGVGGLHLAHLVEQAFDRGLETVDLLAPRSDYKMEWANSTTTVSDFVYAATTRGRVVTEIYQKRLRPLLKSIVPYLPDRVRSWASI